MHGFATGGEDYMKKMLLIALSGLLALAASAVVMMASPPDGVTPTLLARGTYGWFKVKSPARSPVDFQAKSKDPIDIVVRGHAYAVGGTTGWHTHPGPVFITVVEGTVTFYEYDDPSCTPTVVSAGQGYVDTGRGHVGRNETGLPARDVTVIMAPVGQPFRDELPAPGPYCGF
jgi:hypothetical protein